MSGRPVLGLANVETRVSNEVIEEIDLSSITVRRGHAKRRRGAATAAPLNKKKRAGNGDEGGK